MGNRIGGLAVQVALFPDRIEQVPSGEDFVVGRAGRKRGVPGGRRPGFECPRLVAVRIG
ncbi:hypothetical protein LCGC14_2894950, partial [marine sediment metagenome]